MGAFAQKSLGRIGLRVKGLGLKGLGFKGLGLRAEGLGFMRCRLEGLWAYFRDPKYLMVGMMTYRLQCLKWVLFVDL